MTDKRLFDEICVLVQAQSEGGLNDAMAKRLNDLVVDNDEACRLYVDLINETVSLRWWSEHSPAASEDGIRGNLILEAVEQELQAKRKRAEAKAALEMNRQKDLEERRQIQRMMLGQDQPQTPAIKNYIIPRPLLYGGIAAAIALLAVLFLQKPTPVASPTDITNANPDNINQPAVVASLESTVDAVWADGQHRADNAHLIEGDYQLTNGLARIVYSSGAEIVFEAPVRFTLDSEKQVTLAQGKLVGHCPTHKSRGFTVIAPNAQIVDLGTEFGVNVDSSGGADILVFEGIVALVEKGTDAKSLPMAELTAGEARHINRDGALEYLDTSRSQPLFVRSLDPAERYGHLIAASKPLAHYRFDNISMGMARNVIANRYHATLHGNVKPVLEGGRKSYAFSNVGDYLSIDQPLAELSDAQSYSVECWVRTQGFSWSAICSVAVEGTLTGHASSAFLLEIYGELKSSPAQDRKVRFLHRNPPSFEGGTDVNSRSIYQIDRWMHVAAVKSGERMTLYIDGQSVGEVTDALPLPDTHLVAMIGMHTPPPNEPDRYRQFFGQLAELAIYDHALTPEEVQSRVKGAREFLQK